MSINLLLADDEYFIRQRLKKIIPWKKLALNFAGEAENGKQVLDILEKETIDIIILDIKMPHLDGIETTKYIKEHYPNTHIIILSGYSDFQYAQTALKFGVKEYLLKPVSSEDLMMALKKCINDIERELNTQRVFKKYEHFHICDMLTAIRDDNYDYLNLTSQYPEFEKFKYTSYCGLYISEYNTDTITKLAEGLRKQKFVCEYMQESEFIYILQIFFINQSQISTILDYLEHYISCQEHFIFGFMENFFPIEEDWKPYYSRCLQELNRRYFSKHSALICSSSLPLKKEFQSEIIEIRKSFVAILNTQNKDKLSQYLNTIFDSIQSKESPAYLRFVINEFFVIYNLYFHIPENVSQTIIDFSTNIIDNEYSLDRLKNETLFYGLECIKKNTTIPSDVALCSKIMEFINTNYTDSSLSVTQIAGYFQLHPSYLGSIFKKVQHCSILQYISNLRIQKAQELLLESNLKISEVAEAVGYPDVYYFSKKFKKSCGLSPKEYTTKLDSL